jgi:hypothetical protein
MNPRDIFGLVLRLVALWVLVWGCWQLAAAVAMLWRTLHALLTDTTLEYSSFTYLVYAVPAVIFSILLLRFADAIVDFTYRR